MPTLDTCRECLPASCSPARTQCPMCLLCKSMEAAMQPDMAPDDGLLLVARTMEQERGHRSVCRLSLRAGRSTPSPNGSTSPTTFSPPIWDLQTPSLSHSLCKKKMCSSSGIFKSSPVSLEAPSYQAGRRSVLPSCC